MVWSIHNKINIHIYINNKIKIYCRLPPYGPVYSSEQDTEDLLDSGLSKKALLGLGLFRNENLGLPNIYCRGNSLGQGPYKRLAEYSAHLGTQYSQPTDPSVVAHKNFEASGLVVTEENFRERN